MAIKKFERKPLKLKSNINQGDLDLKKNSENHNTKEGEFNIYENTTKEENSNQLTEELEVINNELSICNKNDVLLLNGDKIANLLRVERIEKNIDNNDVTICFRTKYLDKEIELHALRDELLSKKEILKLSRKGCSVNERNAKYHIMSIEYQEERIGKFQNTHMQLGYSEYEGKEVFKLNNAINIHSKYKGKLNIEPKGNLDDYLTDVRKYVVPYKNISLAFAIGVSSAVVAKLGKIDSSIDTILAHFVTESSKGKTTATMLAISVWGNPHQRAGGLYNTWNTTENALISSLTGNYGVAYALDELSMSKIEDNTSLIYKIVGGRDKARLTKDIKIRETGTWITTIISNGEISILKKAKNNTGLEVRVIELDGIVWTEDAKHSDSIKKLANENYGVFGYSFAEKLVKYPIEKLKLLYEQEKEDFIYRLRKKGKVDNIIERTASKYAIVLLTVKLINSGYKSQGIKLDLEGIREILMETEIDSIERRGIKNKAEDWILQYVEANASKFKSGKEFNRNIDYWGTRRELPNGYLEITILRHKFEEIMKQGNFEDTKVVLDQLKKEGRLDHEGGRLTRKRKINAITTSVYVIKLKQ